ncbi:hypothetical protein [Christensenella intestinihominis]|uniref:hypothetical protein n=1 Tax=Christensenella intestinihominis TaxID=1851429 RepID=UPI00082B5D9E|nr:hypothetical protein [Christensenella intestinihominis]
MRKKERNKKKKKVVIILLIVVVAVLAACLIWQNWPKEADSSAERDPNAALGQLEGKSGQEVVDELNKIVEQGMFNVAINTKVKMENGKSEADLRIENIPANHYLMKVQITLDDTDEVIYTSGLIEPNYHIQSAKLDKELEKGTYKATALFMACDMDTGDVVGRASVQFEIQVLN